ncbi:MAG TPA: hypothetical protein VL127_00470 [Bryobacteraceae bacterium]|jgi:hypothetical protein|nr:hypothetical protein [Bryobacteraceae bacterium]
MQFEKIDPGQVVWDAYHAGIQSADVPAATDRLPSPPTLPLGFPHELQFWGLDLKSLQSGGAPRFLSWRFVDIKNGRLVLCEVRGDSPKFLSIAYGEKVDGIATMVSQFLKQLDSDTNTYEPRLLTAAVVLTEALWLVPHGGGDNSRVITLNTAARELQVGQAISLSEFITKLRSAAKRLTAHQP